MPSLGSKTGNWITWSNIFSVRNFLDSNFLKEDTFYSFNTFWYSCNSICSRSVSLSKSFSESDGMSNK